MIVTASPRRSGLTRDRPIIIAETTAHLVNHNGTVVSAESTIAASVAMRNGTILAVGAAEAMPPAREILDAARLHLLPGAIDDHVHFRDPEHC